MRMFLDYSFCILSPSIYGIDYSFCILSPFIYGLDYSFCMQRWEAGSETFKSQMSTIIGDVLLSSAFMAYAGNEIINIIIL